MRGVAAVLLLVLVVYTTGTFTLKPEHRALSEKSNIHLKVTPTTLDEPGQFVNVSWYGVTTGNTSQDWIAVYSLGDLNVVAVPPQAWPATPPWVAPFPDKFHMAPSNQAGEGFYMFQLINAREPHTFVFMRGGYLNPVVAAYSEEVVFEHGDNIPTGGHLALTGNPSEMRLSWVAGIKTASSITMGVSPGKYTHTFTANYTTYSADDLCGFPAQTLGWRDPGYLFTGIMSGLEAGQTYYYRFGSHATNGWSKEFNFTAPKVPSPNVATKYIIFGDMGSGEVDGSDEHWMEPPSLNTTKYVLQEARDADVLAHIGDLSYAVGYAAKWDQFLYQIEPIATHLPYLTALGNHERDWPNSGSFFAGYDSGGECGVPTTTRFTMPVSGPVQDDNWYSIEVGNIHLTVMSTEHPFYIGSPQYAWLESDLKGVDRAVTPWVIFVGHRPMYASNYYGSQGGGEPDLKAALEELLYETKVDMAMWGHVHSYERTCAVYRDECQTASEPGAFAGTTHVVTGAAGMALSPFYASTDSFPSWSLKREETYGFAVINAYNSTDAHVKFIQSSSNKVLDEFWLARPTN